MGGIIKTQRTTVQLSITRDFNGIKLVNDSAAPGNQFNYGTNAAGVKGWQQNFVTWDSTLANVYNPVSSPMPAITTASQNTFYGINIAPGLTSGNRNSIFGINAYALTSGTANTAIGHLNLFDLVDQDNNTAVGFYNGGGNGYGNTLIGYNNMYLTPPTNQPNYNVMVGAGCGRTLGNLADFNVFIGVSVAPDSTTANKNIAIGYQAATSLTTGNRNICIGENSASGVSQGADCIFIGRGSGSSTIDPQEQIVLGKMLSPNNVKGFYVDVQYMQNIAGPTQLYYDPVSGLITYS